MKRRKGTAFSVFQKPSDSSRVWDLRCDVREKLAGFFQKDYPHALPRVRADIDEFKHEEIESNFKGGEVIP
jgi:hypothetical protein